MTKSATKENIKYLVENEKDEADVEAFDNFTESSDPLAAQGIARDGMAAHLAKQSQLTIEPIG